MCEQKTPWGIRREYRDDNGQPFYARYEGRPVARPWRIAARVLRRRWLLLLATATVIVLLVAAVAQAF